MKCRRLERCKNVLRYFENHVKLLLKYSDKKNLTLTSIHFRLPIEEEWDKMSEDFMVKSCTVFVLVSRL